MNLLFRTLITITLFFSGFSFNVLLAQEKLKGYLIDKANNQPVPFATIGVRGKATLGTVSNEDGFFRLDTDGIAGYDTLLITHINYVSHALPVQVFLQQGDSKIQLTESITELSAVEVKASEDYQAFEDIVTQTRKSLRFPMTANVYYRELVKENKSFNKFADGLLTVVYEKDGDENEIKISVDQCRTAKLPKDEDDQFELVSPVKMDLVLGYGFGNFLDRFRKENQSNYHFYSFTENSNPGEHVVIIEPKKEADRKDDKLLYKATIRAGQNNVIREVQIDMDSLCHFEKSALGWKYSINKARIILSFKENDGVNYIAFARFNCVLTFTTKKFQQTEDFVSEFVTIDVKHEAKEIERTDLYKKSSLYKHPDKYESPFWKGLNLPVPTEEEERLILELEKKEKERVGK